jgi:hypothetical protein
MLSTYQIFSFFFVVFFKGKIGIIKKPSQKFVSSLYIVIDINTRSQLVNKIQKIEK